MDPRIATQGTEINFEKSENISNYFNKSWLNEYRAL